MIKQPLIQILKIIALTVTLVFLIAGYMTIISKQGDNTPTGDIAAAPTTAAAATNTQTALPATPTDKPSPAHTAAAAATDTNTPTATASPTQPPTETPTVITVTAELTPTAAETPLPLPTDTPTASITATATLEDTPTPEATPTETPAGPPTETPIPTPTPTPVPRTLPATDAPDFTQAQPHFWFTRPFTGANKTTGSWFYPYGTNNNGEFLWHRGIDIENPQSTPMLAVGDGVVIFAGRDEARSVGPQSDFYGQAVVIQHSNPWVLGESELPVYTLYGHVSQVLVAEGESVTAGQPIALVGQEGVALGPHLHLEVRAGENTYPATQNPDLWLRPDQGKGVIAGRVVDVNGFYVPQQLITLHTAAEPNRFWRQTRTYPDHRYQFDHQLGETFTFADVPAGEYIVKTTFDGRNYSFPVTANNQETAFVLITGEAPPPLPAEETPISEPSGEVEATATPE